MKLKVFLKKINLIFGIVLSRLKKIQNLRGIIQLKERFVLNTKGKISKKLLFMIIGIVLVICVAATLVYYFYFYIKPNFENPSSNYVASVSSGIVSPGEDITYDIYYMNNGYRGVDDLKITVKIPEHTSFSGSTSEYLLTEDSSEIVFELENILVSNSGVINFTINADYPLDNGTIITLEDIEFVYVIRESQFKNTLVSSIDNTIESNPVFKDLEIESRDSSGGHLYMGDTIEYVVKVKNDGNMDATGFRLEAQIPEDNITIDESSINSGGKFVSKKIIWEAGVFKVGDTKTFKFAAQVNEGLDDGDIVETMFTLSNDQDISMHESIHNEIRAFPDFSTSETFISDANGGSLWAGETVNVQVIIKNTGQRTADNYSLFCPTPTGATYISSSGTSEGISWSDDIRGLIWDLKELAPGEEKEINFKIKVNDDLYYRGGTIVTDFRIESGDQEFVPESKSLNISRHIYMTIIAMGDSLIGKSDWVQRFDNLLESTYPIADYNTIASAVLGETAAQGYHRFDSSVAVNNPQIVILSYGTNNVGLGLNNFSVHLEGLVNKARNLGATVFINLIGPIGQPGLASWPQYNQVILSIANKYSLPVIDVLSPLSRNRGKYIYGDGIHYTPEGSAVVAQTVYNSVTPYLDGNGQRR